jgi:hypothetical protein
MCGFRMKIAELVLLYRCVNEYDFSVDHTVIKRNSSVRRQRTGGRIGGSIAVYESRQQILLHKGIGQQCGTGSHER